MSTSGEDLRRIRKILRQTFGFERLRPGQREIIRSVMNGSDTLALMPTGAGKSLCYQLPALLLPGLTLVVSPLISLMKDQLDKLCEAGVNAVLLNSTLTRVDEEQILEHIGQGHAKVVFVTPERLATPDFQQLLASQSVSLAVVDEAHCVSQWGHDFRPDFLEIGHAIAAFGRPPVLALTATATPDVVSDIIRQLKMRDTHVVNTGVLRENLRLSVKPVANAAAKMEEAVALVQGSSGCGIVYAATVRDVERVHQAFVEAGIDACRYHGKLGIAERTQAQESFMTGRCRVVVATNAFGMGIDRADIRFVIHYQMPGSLEAYYQEAGRAGRDGEAADCILLFDPDDRRVQQFFLSGRYPNLELTNRAYEAMRQMAAEAGERGQARRASFAEIVEHVGVAPKNKLQTALKLLVDARLATRDRQRRYRPLEPSDSAAQIANAIETYRKMAEHDRTALEDMMRYAQNAQCRWRRLLEYFHCPAPWERCGTCDNCVSPIQLAPTAEATRRADAAARTHADEDKSEALEAAADAVAEFRPDEAVSVKRYGRGRVVLVSGEQIAIAFPDGQTRTFVAGFVQREPQSALDGLAGALDEEPAAAMRSDARIEIGVAAG